MKTSYHRQSAQRKPDILEVVSRYTSLRQRGREYFGHAVCHNDRSPSLRVNAEKQTWYCDPCAIGGDCIEFIKLAEQTDFRGALKILGIEWSPAERPTIRPESVEIAQWANEQTARANSLLREIGQRMRLANSARWDDELPGLQREWTILEDLTEDLQTAKLIIELYANRAAIEQLLADGEPDDDVSDFPTLTPEYRARITAYARGDG